MTSVGLQLCEVAHPHMGSLLNVFLVLELVKDHIILLVLIFYEQTVILPAYTTQEIV